MASTIHTGNANNTVKRKVKAPGGCEEVTVPIPNSVYDYNRYMGGVDLSDQLLQYYQTRCQTHKYWKTLFYHCLDIAVTNAYILFRLSLPEDDRRRHDHKKFVCELVYALAAEGSDFMPVSKRGRPAQSDIRAQHRLAYSSSGRKYCAVCKSQKMYSLADKYCVQCNVFLCFTRQRDCFTQWHSPCMDSMRNRYM